jgi:hypothetical protein
LAETYSWIEQQVADKLKMPIPQENE